MLSVLLLSAIFTGCGGRTIYTDPDAYVIGEDITVSADTMLHIASIIESEGSDVNRPDRGHGFYIVRFRFTNNGNSVVELHEQDFHEIVDGVIYRPIDGRMGFVPDKMPATQEVAPGETVSTRLVWMLPRGGNLLVLEFSPDFADQDIRINMYTVD